ncbi:unnamed protein product [Amoebophrya sp. A25]|nr:unnamed protein product [Amoebophrya sp. A25]|eukprot:GSA25T00008697001.1
MSSPIDPVLQPGTPRTEADGWPLPASQSRILRQKAQQPIILVQQPGIPAQPGIAIAQFGVGTGASGAGTTGASSVSAGTTVANAAYGGDKNGTSSSTSCTSRRPAPTPLGNGGLHTPVPVGSSCQPSGVQAYRIEVVSAASTPSTTFSRPRLFSPNGGVLVTPLGGSASQKNEGTSPTNPFGAEKNGRQKMGQMSARAISALTTAAPNLPYNGPQTFTLSGISEDGPTSEVIGDTHTTQQQKRSRAGGKEEVIPVTERCIGCCWLCFVSPFYCTAYTLAATTAIIGMPCVFLRVRCCMDEEQRHRHAGAKHQRQMERAMRRGQNQLKRQRATKSTADTGQPADHNVPHSSLYWNDVCFCCVDCCPSFCRSCSCCPRRRDYGIPSFEINREDLNGIDLVIRQGAIRGPGEIHLVEGTADNIQPEMLVQAATSTGLGAEAPRQLVAPVAEEMTDFAGHGLHILGENVQDFSTGEALGTVTGVADGLVGSLEDSALAGTVKVITTDDGGILGVIFEKAGEAPAAATEACEAFCGVMGEATSLLGNCLDSLGGIQCGGCDCDCNPCACCDGGCDCGNCGCCCCDCDIC